MFITTKWFVASSIFIAVNVLGVKPVQATHNNGAAHDVSTPAMPIQQSPVDNSVPVTGFSGNLDSDTGTLSVEGLGRDGEVVLSPDVIQSIDDISGVTAIDNTTATGADSLDTASSDTVTICYSEPCVPSGESTKAVTLGELAKLLEDDLQSSLTRLAEAEKQQQIAESQPRRFTRRRSVDCNCGNSVAEARQEVESKLAQSQKFLELMKRLNPQNSKW